MDQMSVNIQFITYLIGAGASAEALPVVEERIFQNRFRKC